MILELQLKYLREMEAFYCHCFIQNKIPFGPGMCNISKSIGGSSFSILFINEAYQYCISKKMFSPNFYYFSHWFGLDRQGIRTRKNIVRAIRKRKEALLKECIY